jgi:hypothetical protein
LYDESPELFDAITEYAHALEQLKGAIDELQIPFPEEPSESATPEQIDEYYRWLIPPLKPQLLEDVERTVNGVEVLLMKCQRILKSSIEESEKNKQEALSEPEDLSAYRNASEFLDGIRFKDIGALKRVLDKHPNIRRYKPAKNRLLVHAGDLMEFTQSEKEQALAADKTLAKTTNAYLSEQAKRREHRKGKAE